MPLTQRRKDFLEHLIDIYHRTVRPVHYETLAREVGVSKWTAYDMLNELEKAGFLAREYVVPAGTPGRSQVVYVPTDSAYGVSGKVRSDSAAEEAVNRAKEKVMARVAGMHPNESGILKEMLQDIQNSRNQAAYCIYVIGLLVLVLRISGGDGMALIKRFVLRIPSADMRLAAFTGAVAGNALPALHAEMSVQSVDLLEGFLAEAGGLAEESAAVVSEFLVQVLNQC